MSRPDDVWQEAQDALTQVWFVQTLEETERTDHTLSFRLYIRPDLFVQVFAGELTGSLYLALIEGEQRIFGLDRIAGAWHVHPFNAPHTHTSLPEGLGPRPLLEFLARVEELLLQQDLL